MAVPKQRHNSSRTNRRRKHNIAKKKDVVTITCESCKEQMLSHRVCAHCGMYKGVQYKEIVQRVG